MIKIFILFGFLALASCARVKTIGLKEVKFNDRPTNIIWMQVPGLTMEQLAVLRFSYSNINEKSSLESSQCLSAIWSYNLFKLRPTAYEGFLSQMTGSRNIKNTCADFSHKPVWSHLKKDGFLPVIFESGVKDNESLSRAYQCQNEGELFRKDLTLFRMSSSSNPSANIFHHQERSEIPKTGVYFDRSCKRGVCYAKSLNNIDYLWKKYSQTHPRVLFIVRNFEIRNAIRRKDMAGLKSALDDLDKTYRLLSIEAMKKGKTLLLVTSSVGQRLELPLSGRKWEEFERIGKNVTFKRTSLVSTGFAKGASFENFCGFFDDSQLLQRILWAPTKQRPVFF